MGVRWSVPRSWFGMGRGLLWSHWWCRHFILGSHWVNFTRTCHTGNKTNPTESIPASELITHPPSAVFQSIGGSFWTASTSTWVEEDSGELKWAVLLWRGHHGSLLPEHSSLPGDTKTHTHTRSHQFPQHSPPLSSQFLREREGPSILSSSLELASSKSSVFFPGTYSLTIHLKCQKGCPLYITEKTTSISDLYLRPSSWCVRWS